MGFGAASSLFDELVSAKIARSATQAITRNRTPLEFFFAGAAGAAVGFVAAGALVTVVVPRDGTGGITIFEASTLAVFFATARFAVDFFAEDFLAGAFFAGAFFAGRFAAFADFFTTFLTGRFAAAFFTGRFAAFFFAATTTPS